MGKWWSSCKKEQYLHIKSQQKSRHLPHVAKSQRTTSSTLEIFSHCLEIFSVTRESNSLSICLGIFSVTSNKENHSILGRSQQNYPIYRDTRERREGKVSSRERFFNNSRKAGTVNVMEDTEWKWTEGGVKMGSEGNVPSEGWTSCWKVSGKVASASQSLPSPSRPLSNTAQRCHRTEFCRCLAKDARTHMNLVNFKAANFKFSFTLRKPCVSF